MSARKRTAIPIAPGPPQVAAQFANPRAMFHPASVAPDGNRRTQRREHDQRASHERLARHVAQLSQEVGAIPQLRASHEHLARQVEQLTQEVGATRQLIEAEKRAMSHNISSRTKGSLLKAQLFARVNARKMLTTASSELARTTKSLCSSNAVRQVLLKSRASDCTLSDFRSFASECLRKYPESCSVFPSEYYSNFASASRASRFFIVFDTYRDFCDALHLDVDCREAGVYMEKRNMSRNVRAVQVLGVECILPALADPEPYERVILLGCTMRSRTPSSEEFVLVQENTAWNETSFEAGFVQKRVRLETVFGRMHSMLASEFTEGQNSDINGELPEQRAFTLEWERTGDVYYGTEGDPDMVPGSLRSSAPAIVLRTRILTASARQIFATRIDGKYLKQHLSSQYVTRIDQTSNT